MDSYEMLSKHVNCVGVHIVKSKDADAAVELRCFARSHGGKDVLLLRILPSTPLETGASGAKPKLPIGQRVALVDMDKYDLD